MRYPTRRVGDSTLVANRVISTAPCKLTAVTGFSDGTAAYMMIFDSATVPPNGTAAAFSFPVDANRAFAFALPNPVDLDACTVVPSSTVDTLTAVAGSHQNIQGLLAS